MIVNSLKHNDPRYPARLRNIHRPPSQIYWLGTSPIAYSDRPAVAIVGSRKVSAYGRQVTERLAGELARSGVVIVSGLALGVDSIAHQAVVDAGGLTLAIMPTGLDRVYPASHLQLAKRIVDGGGSLLSEYAPGSQVYPGNFIARSRIVSGLADVVVITEAARASGTMHTANFGLEQGKTVMAVPGNINSPLSEGCNNLIKKGAVPVTSVSDILDALGIKVASTQTRVFRGSQDEQRLYELIKSGVSQQEELAAAAKLDGAKLSANLTMLEINGYVKADGGHWLAN